MSAPIPSTWAYTPRAGERPIAFRPEPVPPLSFADGEQDVTPSVRGDDVGLVVASYADRGRYP